MKELDVVKLNEDYKGLSANTQGTIVLKYDDTLFEVEFFNNDGDTIDVLTTPIDLLELITEV
ncbi:MAG: DUF4926 domain-containing protein [Clostridia bacterium]|nr:DUF4926 domain-containing protein [Clostridia bacterium]